MTTNDLIDLHRALVAIPSISGDEKAVADFTLAQLHGHGEVERIGDNVIARKGSGPLVILCSHLDTVPPNDGWTRPPWEATVEDGAVRGLGSNDAKASVAAMIEAWRAFPDTAGLSVALLLVSHEETGGPGVERAWPILRERGWDPAAVVVGEPTDLQIAVAQKGMLVLELHAHGDACHSANARALGARNPIWTLARDLVRLEALDLGEDPYLGPTTLQATVLRAGEARNQVPATAWANLDLRTVPGTPHAALVARLRSVVEGEVRVRSDRLIPTSCPAGASVLEAALAAGPRSRPFGSATMSDLVFFDGFPAIKVGPGKTERSHRPDEFVRVDEIEEGAVFYGAMLRELALRLATTA